MRVLLVGESCLDVYHIGEVSRISQEAPVPILKKTKEMVVGGMSLNVLNNLQSSGLKVDHITNSESVKKHRFVDGKFNQQMLRVDEGENFKLKSLDLSKIVGEYDYVIISDYNKGFLPYNTCKSLCDRFKNARIFVDSKKRDLSCFVNCVVKINEKEYCELNAAPVMSDLIITRGAAGAELNGRLHSQSEIPVFDVSGAGDVFLSAIAIFSIFGKNIEDSMDFANMASGISVGHHGTYSLTKADWEVCFEKNCN